MRDQRLPHWAVDIAAWVGAALVGILGWFLTNTVNEMKADVRSMNLTVFQLRQDVAVIQAMMHTKEEDRQR
jgi:riboflavin synthase